MLILGIETSCDETAASVLQCSKIKAGYNLEIISEVVASQINVHQKNNGIIPEIAACEHLKAILPVIESAVKEVSMNDIDAIAVTVGPGLLGSLLLGTEAAKILSYVFHKPLVAINHLEGHIYASFLGAQKIQFPIIALIVSGGHTQIILMTKHLSYKLIGETVDDAAGEAFDKVARLLGLSYPGGPIIEQLAKNGNDQAFQFPRPMVKTKDYNFSFSGLKTSVLYTVQKLRNVKTKLDQSIVADLAASFQQAVIDVLIAKTVRAAKEFGAKTLIVGGGVAANGALTTQLAKAVKKEIKGINYISPSRKLCTDNGTIIAVAGYFHALQKDFTPWQKVFVNPDLRLD